MDGKRLLGLVSVVIVSVPAMAAADEYLYSDTGLEAQGVLAIQQHTVFVEIVTQDVDKDSKTQIHQFAAVVALVKKCLQKDNRQVFDNAVLWFNDQFLFGDKKSEDVRENFTSGRLGVLQAGYAEYEGQPENRSEAKAFNIQGKGRWVGCFVPEGFLHAIGADDPVGTGTAPDADTEKQVPGVEASNIGAVKQLIELDNNVNCDGCIFTYTGSFYITDPNGVNWLVDKFVYPAALTHFTNSGDCTSPSGTTLAEDVHTGVDPTTGAVGVDAGCPSETHSDTQEDSGGGDAENHCFEEPSTAAVCDADHGDETDTPRSDSAKLTTLEPLYTVHLQVDPADMEAISDEALWAWSSGPSAGTIRSGAPRYEDVTDTSSPCQTGNADSRCAIEYSALIVVDFEAFDDLVPFIATDTGEDEISRNRKVHGNGGLDEADESKEANSHPNNPTVDPGDSGPVHKHDSVSLDLFFMGHDDTTCSGAGEPTTGNRPECGAPRFTVVNGGFRDGPGAVTTTGRPPRATDAGCTTDDGAHGEGSAPLSARVFIVCDIDADTGEFHAHDGSQTIGGGP